MARNPGKETAPESEGHLRQHVKRTYALARLLSEDEEAAARIVRAAFEQVTTGKQYPAGREHASESAHLFALVVAAAGSRIDDQVTGFDRKQARIVLQRLFPPAFSSMQREERLALYLSEVERIDRRDLGVVLGTDEDGAAVLTDEAHGSLWEAIMDAASESESELLLRGLPDSWLRASLESMLRQDEEPPDSLYSAVERTVRGRRPATAETELQSSRAPRRARSVATPISLVLLVGMIGYASATFLEKDRHNNLLSMTAALVSQTAPQLEAPSRTVAGEFILDQLGRRARIPVIGEALFRGAGIVRLATSDRAPVLYYDDLAHGGRLVVTIYDYETIERLEQTIELPADLLEALERENELFVSTTPRGAVAAWRHRADVYVASGTSDSVKSLDTRVTFAGDDID